LDALVVTSVHAFTFLTNRETTVLGARRIRALNASEPHRRREVPRVPDPSADVIDVTRKAIQR
jgi:hypothetical protein